MLQRERPRGVRLGIEVEADALLSTSGMQAYSIALKRAEEASSDEMARDWSVVAATIARRSGRRSSLVDALFGWTGGRSRVASFQCPGPRARRAESCRCGTRPLDGRTSRRPPAICYVRFTSTPTVCCAQKAAVPHGGDGVANLRPLNVSYRRIQILAPATA